MSTRVLSMRASCRFGDERAWVAQPRINRMADTFVAHASVTIDASRARVWDALVNPDSIKKYMPVTEVLSEWREDSPIVWKSEFQGKSFEVWGTVRRLEA